MDGLAPGLEALLLVMLLFRIVPVSCLCLISAVKESQNTKKKDANSLFSSEFIKKFNTSLLFQYKLATSRR